jgi:heme oxygenase (biliverdin-IX-beta and delta-forming)
MATMSPWLGNLRTATCEIHQRLHLHPAFAPLACTPPDLPGYAGLLGQLQGFHAPVEAWLFGAAERHLPELTDLARRRKAHLLGADLASLAAIVSPSVGLAPAMEIGGDLSRAAVLGGLYVTEGSTLGGRELGRRLEQALWSRGLVGTDGRRFLLAYGTRQGAMWRRFCAIAEQVAQDFSAAEHADMTRTARELFLRLEDWLTRVPVAS